MHAMIVPIPAPATRYASGLRPPRRAASKDGSPKMLAPIIVLTTSAARLHRPMARTKPLVTCRSTVLKAVEG